MTRGTKTALLVVAAALLAAAAVWSYIISLDDPLGDMAKEMNAFGYSLEAEDFYVLGGAENTTIAATVNEDMSAAVEASMSAGFPSNIDRFGDITVLLAHLGDDRVLTVYLVDGETELCFVQNADGGISSPGAEE